METINDRIECIINQYFKGNKAAFANAIGLPPTSMSSYFGTKRRSKPSVDMVAKIVKCLNADAKWLLIGEKTSKETLENATAVANGQQSIAAVNSHVDTADTAILEERIKMLQAVVSEKERLIQVLLKDR